MAKTILIIDDHPVVLFGLRFLFEGRRDLTICGEAGDAVLAAELAERLRPDLIVLDLVLGGRDGLELLRNLSERSPRSRVLIYSSQSERLMARKSQTSGAWGYVSKSEGLPIVAQALRSIAKGLPYFPTLEARIPSASDDQATSSIDSLSARESQVLRMLGERMSSQEISEALGVSIKTVGTYRERIKTKLSLPNARDLDDTASDFVKGRFEP